MKRYCGHFGAKSRLWRGYPPRAFPRWCGFWCRLKFWVKVRVYRLCYRWYHLRLMRF